MLERMDPARDPPPEKPPPKFPDFGISGVSQNASIARSRVRKGSLCGTQLGDDLEELKKEIKRLRDLKL
jgi:hypothetical protein